MRKLLLLACVGVLGTISCRTGPEPEIRSSTRALTAPLPPITDYTAGAPLPTTTYTHMVVAYCQQLGTFMAAGVDATSGTVVFFLRGSESSSAARFLPAAYGVGVPVTVYTAPVAVLPEDAPPPLPSDPLPIAAKIFPTCTVTGDVGDPPPGGGNPTGDEELPGWKLFGDLASRTAEALHRVSRAAPSPTGR